MDKDNFFKERVFMDLEKELAIEFLRERIWWSITWGANETTVSALQERLDELEEI